MDDREKVITLLDDMRLFVDLTVHSIVSPDNWNVYSELCDFIDLTKEVALSLLKAQEPGWINVKDRLPEDGQEVLGFLYHGGCEILTFLAAKNRWQGTDAWYWFEEISHWMPLPEPPKEDK